MAHSSIRYQSALLSTSSAAGAHLLLARQAIAHADHYANEETEHNEAVAPTPKTDLSKSESNPVSEGESLDRETAVQAVPVAQEPVNTSSSGLLNGFSIGVGEPLLALIIVGPFLLRFWKRRSHS